MQQLNNGGTVLVFDTETTGLAKDYDAPASAVNNWPRIVQLGMAFQHIDGTVQTYKTLIKPPNGMAFPIPASATKIHKVTDAMCVAKGIPIADALDQFEHWLNSADVVIAHNLGFDRPVLSCEAYRLKRQLRVSKGKQLICTKEATTEFCAIPKDWGDPYKWPTLQELHCKLFGVGFEGAHDALSDVLATLKCYNKLTTIGSFDEYGDFLPSQL